jgi:hypothetical protein
MILIANNSNANDLLIEINVITVSIKFITSTCKCCVNKNT